MNFKKTLCLSLLASSLLIGCNKPEYISKINTNDIFITAGSNNYVSPFNTVMTLIYKSEKKDYTSTDKGKKLSSIYRDMVVKLHKNFDRHYSYKDDEGNEIVNIKTINDSYGTNQKIYCTPELYNLLKTGVIMTMYTEGYFNFYIGQLVNFWDDLITEDDQELIEANDPIYNEANRLYLEDLTASIPTLE